MSSFKDFAVGQVATAPSPATSGTTLVLGSGQGSRMPTPPFYATATPPGTIPSLDVSEIVKVTNVAGNTLTIVRAQKGTSAKSIATNWLFVNAIYADDMFSSSITMDEALTGTVNGSNQVFTTVTPFSSIDVYKNGVRMHVGDDFTVTGSNQITFITPPATGTKLTATYITGSQVMISGGNSIITKETPSGLVNGLNQGYATTNPYVPGSLQVYVNGLAQGSLVEESDPSLGTFFLDTAPLTGDNLQVSYQFTTGVTGNADTLDGEHLLGILQAIYPVGAVYVSGSGTMPALIQSVGTWDRLNGRVIVGLDETQTEFDTVDETGGHKAMQAHTHALNIMNSGDEATGYGLTPSGGGFTNRPQITAGVFGKLTSSTGTGNAGNLQPYKVKYMWERTA